MKRLLYHWPFWTGLIVGLALDAVVVYMAVRFS